MRNFHKLLTVPAGLALLATSTLRAAGLPDPDGNSGKYPQHKGNVASVYSHPLSLGGASNSHCNGNSKTCMNIGLAMGEAMVELLRGE